MSTISSKISEVFAKAKESGFAKVVIEDSAITLAKVEEEKHTIDLVLVQKSVDKPATNNFYYVKSPIYATKYSIANLKIQFYKKWEMKRQLTQTPKKNWIELKSLNPFSDIFKNAFGVRNIENIQGIDDVILREQIFIAFLEGEAVRQYQNNKSLQSLFQIDSRELWGSHSISNNTLLWKLGRNAKESTGFIAYISTLFTIPYMDAVATLANILCADMENLFSVFSVETRIVETRRNDLYSNNIVHDCLVQNVGLMNLAGTTFIKGHSEQTVGAFLHYYFDNLDFVLPACAVRGKLTMGLHKSPAFLLNQDKLDRNRNAMVIFFQDIRVAIAVDKIVQESNFISDAEIIITAHVGNNLPVVGWNYLYNKEVVLVVAPTKASFSQVGEYKDYAEKAHAKSFTIYSEPILRSKLSKSLSAEELDQCSPFEQELYANCRIIDEIESPSRFAREISEKAISYDDFLDWGVKLNLFKGKKQIAFTDNINHNPVFDFKSYTGSATNCFQELTFLDIIPHITMLHAPKDAGKSLTSISIAKAISTASPVFGFKRKVAPQHTLHFDSETPPDILKERLVQLQVIKDSFKVISKVSMQDAFWGRFDLLNEEHRKELEHFLKEMEIQVVIFDNLTSLIESGNIYTPETARTVMNWTSSLKDAGIAVIIVHHTLDEGKAESKNSKMRGSDEWRIRCQTEIQLINKHEALAMKNLSEEVHLACKKDGATVGMLFKSCKSAPVVTDKIVWLHLGLGDNEWKRLCVTDLEGNELSFGENVGNAFNASITEFESNILQCGFLNVMSKYPDLSPDEQKVVQFANEKSSFNRNDIDTLLNCKDSKSNKLIKGLEDRKILSHEGEGKARTYRLRTIV